MWETVTLINDDISTLLNIHMISHMLVCPHSITVKLHTFLFWSQTVLVSYFPRFCFLGKINIFLLKTMRCCILFWLDLLTFRWKNIWEMSEIILYDWESSEERFVFLGKFCNASNVQTIQHHFLWQQVKKIILDKDKWNNYGIIELKCMKI